MTAIPSHNINVDRALSPRRKDRAEINRIKISTIAAIEFHNTIGQDSLPKIKIKPINGRAIAKPSNQNNQNKILARVE